MDPGPGRAFLMVRAVVADPADRARFDAWYRAEHLPDALRRFGALEGWRWWSRTEPAVHYAVYAFPDLEAARRATAPERIAALVGEFDRVWGDRVARTRELVEAVDHARP